MSPPHVAIVGGGISGLAAAWFLRHQPGSDPRPSVTVLEAASDIGGKLRLMDVGGLRLDAGAEAMLARRPEAVALTQAVGLGDDLVYPATTQAGVWTRGRIRPLPAGHVMGVPTNLPALARSRVLSAPGLGRAAAERLLPVRPYHDDISVGAYVAARYGREVVDRLVEPVLGGVYAGHADRLSLEAVAPQLAAHAHAGTRVRPTKTADASPIFAGIRGGVGRLPPAVAEASRADIRTGVTVRELCRTPSGWRLITGPSPHPEAIDADAVVLALPARPAARLLRDAAPAAAAELSTIAYASVVLVTLVFPAQALIRPLYGSGLLVPPVEGRLIKAATYSSAKWHWVAEQDRDLVAIRVSIGRYGEQHDIQRDDKDLINRTTADLTRAIAVAGRPVTAEVVRWGGALPQYAVGHISRVRRIRDGVVAAGGLAVCGAAYDGIGIAACIASAEAAAEKVLQGLPAHRNDAPQ